MSLETLACFINPHCQWVYPAPVDGLVVLAFIFGGLIGGLVVAGIFAVSK